MSQNIKVQTPPVPSVARTSRQKECNLGSVCFSLMLMLVMHSVSFGAL